MALPGSYPARRKDGTEYFRASITYKDRHISLGSFDSDKKAGEAYLIATKILNSPDEFSPEDYEKQGVPLSFDRWIVLLNLKKTGIYCKNPILLYGKYFLYYIDRKTALKFDVDDMFFYRTHRIQKRGNHLFYSDYGMQTSLLSRYGVRSFAVKNRDYFFKNGDENDYSYGNIVIVNRYNGVQRRLYRGRYVFEVKIHMLGNVTVGRYSDETEAAIAYNKAADSIEEKFREKNSLKEYHEDTYGGEDDNMRTHAGKAEDISGKSDDCINCVGQKSDTQYDVFYNSRLEYAEKCNNSENEENDEKSEKSRKYRSWRRNYVEDIKNSEYLKMYERIKFTKSFRRYLNEL
ncbi:MAG: hypothetical protein MJ131_08585 [Lachnospiraceae bacterium]|nr:hypothetical protein [Lachnospiraceae bacterium]